MTNVDFWENREWFNQYVNGYLASHPELQKNLLIKIQHTQYVIDAVLTLYDDTYTTPMERNIAASTALFHDIGRFEQYTSYKTFSDNLSTDHGNLGVNILKKNNVLQNISDEEKNYIYNAVQFHNKKRIPDHFKGKERFFIELIRDADKIDIFRLTLEHYKMKDNNQSLTLELPDEKKYCQSAIDDILHNKIVDKSCLATVNDFKLLQLSWVFDLNFKKSLEIIHQKKYIDAIFETLPDESCIRMIKKHISAYVTEQLSHITVNH